MVVPTGSCCHRSQWDPDSFALPRCTLARWEGPAHRENGAGGSNGHGLGAPCPSRDAGQVAVPSPACWLQCPKHHLCAFQWLWSHLQFYPAVQMCHRAAPSSLMDIRAPPYARIGPWWLVLSDWPFMGKYVLLRVWAFAMVALCPRRQGYFSCQLPALALCTWFSLWKRRGDWCILRVFGEECTAACENDLWHVLCTKNVRQAQHWGLSVGSTCDFLAVIAGSSSAQPPSNSHGHEEHNVHKNPRISILFLLLFVSF